MDDEGQVTLEEDRVSGGGVRVWRTIKLFREEFFLITVGFIITFVQVAASAFIPQLNQSYQEAMFVPRSHWPFYALFISFDFIFFAAFARWVMSTLKKEHFFSNINSTALF
jgi:hypothetical protein